MDHATCQQMDRKGKQEMDHAACRQMDRGRTGDGSFNMPADEQRQGRRWIIQHAGRWTEAGQEMDHTAYQQMDRDRAGDGSYTISADGQRQGRRWIIQHAADGQRQENRQHAMLQSAGNAARSRQNG